MSVIENTSSENSINEEVEATPNTEISNEPNGSAAAEVDVDTGSTTEPQETTESKTAKKVEIPVEDYTVMSQDELLASLKKLVSKYPVQLIKNQVEDIRGQFNKNFDEKAAASKETFLAEGENEIDFHYTTPLKREFNDHYFNYKDKRNKYYEAQRTNQQNNLKNRLQLIEELKELIAAEGSVGKKFESFKELKEKWFQAGAIPRDDKNTVWNTFYHHVDKFYEVVHLDREFRDLDYKHNLEQKMKILERAKELTAMENVTSAFRELQVLHKIWKEEIGPVAKEHKEIIWEKFSELTKEVHQKRQAYFEEQDAKQEDNLKEREAIIQEMLALSQVQRNSHKDWQLGIEQVQVLHDKFKAVGRVPKEMKNNIWERFRGAEREFNVGKNTFYKSAKNDQLDNLKKKKALIEIAENNKDSEDFESTTELMKKIQHDWKKIGHVPRKDSDKVWNQFRAACNHYFDRLTGLKAEANEEREKSFEAKSKFLEALKDEKVTDLEGVLAKIESWKILGPVPGSKRKIEEQFSKVLDELFGQLNIDKKEAELLKFEAKLNDILASNNPRILNDEKNFIRKKLDESKQEILQLENNLQFFKHADKSNPMVADVYKKIDRHNANLEIWQAKWDKIKRA